jgi:beta-glucanase (GH16 family)
MGLPDRISIAGLALRAGLTSIARRYRRRVVLVVMIGLLLQGASQASDQRDPRRRHPAVTETTMQATGRGDLGQPSTWRDSSQEPSTSPDPAGGRPGSWVTRISASPTAIADAAGHLWSPDAGYADGRSAVTDVRVEGTDSPVIYQHERRGMSAYRIPVPAPGTYAVDLYLAETTFSKPGQRVFDVSAEGTVKASDVDIVREAGRNRAYHVIFTVAVIDGRLDVGFIDKIYHAKVNGIEVAFVRSSTAERQLVWSDEFNGSRNAPVDSRRWGHEVGGAWGDGELQAYTNRIENSHQDGRGHLVIAARAEPFTGADSIARDYTSARISTKNKYSFQYGVFEARLRTPIGKGLWPAFWALGTDIDRSGWPNCGEIDVMENLGHEPRKASGTIHGPRGGGEARADYEPGYSIVNTSALSQGFHTYSARWLPGSIEFYFDGRRYGAIVASDLAAASRWVFDHPFYLVLNVAVGGQWAGSPDATTRLPQALQVDYVRVYQ